LQVSPTLHEATSVEAGGKQVVGGIEILSRRVRREVERQLSERETVLFCLRGSLGHSLVAVDERLLIVKPGFHAGTTFGALRIEVSSPSFQGRERKRNRQPRSSDCDVYKLPNCVPISTRRVDAYHEALARLRDRIEPTRRRAPVPTEATPLIASLERIANLRQSGALSEPEYQRLKGVLLASADRGMTLSAPRLYTESG
jgi:hypothetical protein